MTFGYANFSPSNSVIILDHVLAHAVSVWVTLSVGTLTVPNFGVLLVPLVPLLLRVARISAPRAVLAGRALLILNLNHHVLTSGHAHCH